jgi:hypothetical protein
MVEPLVMASRDALSHLLKVAPTTLEEAMQIQACGVFNGTSATLKASQVRGEVGIEMRQCRSNQPGNPIGVFELTL